MSAKSYQFDDFVDKNIKFLSNNELQFLHLTKDFFFIIEKYGTLPENFARTFQPTFQNRDIQTANNYAWEIKNGKIPLRPKPDWNK